MNDDAAQATLEAQVFLEHLDARPRANILDKSSLASERLHRMVTLTMSLIPEGAPVAFVFSGDFVSSVQSRLTKDSNVPGAYTVERGANVAVARTMARGDGGYDVVFNTDHLFSYEGDAVDEVNYTDNMLNHLAAHEAQHVWLGWTETNAEFFQDLVDEAEVGVVQWRFRKGIAVAMEEYRCERSANSVAPASSTRQDAFSGDIAHFRESLNSARSKVNSDIQQALLETMTAVNELWKALAYLAAELPPFVAGEAVPVPSTPVEGWDEYLGDVWPILVRLFSMIPPANEETTTTHLATVTGMLCQALVKWLSIIGIEYDYNDEGESCYWRRQKY